MSIEFEGNVRLRGILGGKNASAISLWRHRALVVTDEVTDEGNVVQVFERDGDDFRAVDDEVIVLDADEADDEDAEEMDLEGLAVDGDDVFVIGSHSAKRKKMDPDRDYDKNRTALQAPSKAEPARDVLLHFRLKDGGSPEKISRTSLRSYLNANEPFKSFSLTGGKENGVDVEGLAVWNDHLYVGFRGPVLRGNFAAIVKCKFGSPIRKPEVLFVDLGGRGIRDLAQAEEGILILAGPVGDGPGSYQLYLWDGRDMVPGKGAPTSPTSPGLHLIGDLPSPISRGVVQTSAKAEGLALIEETNACWQLLIVYDGLDDGQATRLKVPKR